MRNRSNRNSSSNHSGSSERRPEQTAAGAEGRLSGAALEGLRSECSVVWFDRVAYERAESLYYVRLLRQQNGTNAPASSSRNERGACHHGEREACHHVVRTVWVNKPDFDRAESRFVGRAPDQPRSLQLAPPSCDEGYRSQTPTPPTPASGSVNGLPSLPPPPMGVWLQKPLFDKAEATFYRNACGRSSLPRTDESDSKRRGDAQKKPAICGRRESNGAAVKLGAAPRYFLHADSERVWLDRGRYAEAETRFYEEGPGRSCKPPKNHSSQKLKKMTAAECLAQERIWFDKPRYDEAERQFYERVNGPTQPKQSGGGSAADFGELAARMKDLELENQSLHKVVKELRSALGKMESRVSALEKRTTAPTVNGTGPVASQKAPAAPAKREEEDEDEDDIDLFGSDEEVDEEAERLKEQRLQEYAAKKAKKPVLIAKSSILLDVKPWDDETDMAKLEECVRSVQVDGLLWGASKLVPVGYGIKKLQINCVVEDDKVGTDFLEEEITKFEDHVQSVDVAAFNKI
ncbi:eukaryotic translation elongation factor 1 delta b (guanine nucleotide exchange protein) isoform X3 [Puntigrus tetrazona]|uniref:eukaryotic translation elongation factor 1 delta b (guanine nucleotide exchange protein) isoform X3 n=2 Tax=Puntigrus tetrazona TaxID=1606681 RepID=UPI001C8A3E9B|nr:eukaryotic translation elongation factor 1 delta b (guanine nucleotide exchange protein) isoform X3 [Puntigrus tetrazona]